MEIIQNAAEFDFFQPEMSVVGTKRTSSNVRCLVANGGKADIVERRGDLKEMVTGMELASPAAANTACPPSMR
jgi:hypothetical protein